MKRLAFTCLLSICLVQMAKGQGAWVLRRAYTPELFRLKLRNYHDGGWEKLFMTVDPSSAFSQGSVYDSAQLGSGGHVSASATRGSTFEWDFVPVVETGEGGSKSGVGLATFQGAQFTQDGSAKAPDGPAMAKFAISQHVKCVIDEKTYEKRVNSGAASTTDANLLGNLTIPLPGKASFTIKIIIYTGSIASDSNHTGQLGSPKNMEAGFVGLLEETTHFVEIKADAIWGSASATETASANEITGVELSSKWK